MELDFTTHFVPVFWGLVALLLFLCGVLLASVDPEISRPSFRKLNLLFGSIAAMLLAMGSLLVAGVSIVARVVIGLLAN
jgi:hypothetical protein